MIEALSTTGYEIYAFSLAGLWLVFGLSRRMRERGAAARWEGAVQTGATEPPTLHPVIDPQRCIGCGACANACPEGDIIGMMGGKAQLLEPSSCIGHGACKTACPVGAIDLVFGTARRGVDIPHVFPNFETNVPGLFIAGELGGMGLIANAVEQGCQAIDAIAERPRASVNGSYDVVIVGGGPAGIAASLAAKKHKLSFITLEQDTVGGTVALYPRTKIAMTRAAKLPLYGKVRLRRVRKERLLTLWEAVLRKSQITIHERVRVERIAATQAGFDVTTTSGSVRAASVLLATGRRGAPRRLSVAGEDLPKVTYGLDDASRYRGQHILVVGGGDSALEAINTLARHPVASLTLSYRGSVFDRPRPAQRQRFEAIRQAGRVNVISASVVTRIEHDQVVLDQGGVPHVLRNDAVIVCVGGVLPTELLADIGVHFERKFGHA